MALFDLLNWQNALCVALVIIIYSIARCVYLLYFHPASKFPGPKLAAISYASYCYYW